MSKFNLKTYQKISGDKHIDSRLQDEHENAPNEINEKQLDTHRAKEPEVLTEKQLEENRKANGTKEATEVLERRLDNEKGDFGIKMRNASAYEGDLPKLEEQRLSGDPVENEKYEDASQTPKQLRWWEQGGKSPDGLKVAQKKTATLKTAQLVNELTFDKPRFEETLEEDISPLENDTDESAEESAINPLEQVKEEYEIEDISDVDDLPDFDIEDETADNQPVMYISKQKDLTGDIPAIYMVLGFDAELFKGNKLAIKQAALDKVLEERPELKGIIDISDFGNIKETGAIGEVTLRLIDDRLSSILGSQEVDDLPSEGFEEVSYKIDEMGGTPMASGVISFEGDFTENADSIISGALEYIQNQYGITDIDEDSLDLSDVDNGEIGFLIEAPQEELTASVDFPVIEITAQSTKKK